MLTLKYIRAHFKEQGYEPRHSFHGLKAAVNKTAKEYELGPEDLFHLLIENVPMTGTHSYGFHTAFGRELIGTMTGYYHQFNT